MRQQIKDLSHQINCTSDDYDARCIRNLNYLVDSASDNKKFCLHWYDINGMMDSFGNGIMAQTDIWYQCNDIVLDTSVRNNDDCIGVW